MSFRPCIVIPVYNHCASAAALSEQLSQFGLPLIMVNDGSDADGAAILHGLSAAHDWIDVIDHVENQGKGGAVMTGLKAAYYQGFSHALQIDADGQHDAGDIPRFLKISEENPGAVIAGHPMYDESIPKARLMGHYFTRVWIWIETLSFTIKDSMCGFRIYPLVMTNRVLSTARLGKRMDFDPAILVRLFWDGAPVLSLSTKVTYPAGGKSHFRLWHDNCLITCMHTQLVIGMLWRVPFLVWRKFQ
ncbi:MAG: glycosyltransferase family 2 protein [Rhodospirillaceae bacterium]|jgi:glycosyltransferase involved in cell wall biosynthesis|nr:glycosyltransferase family 2 protein [Rhodospirillaceae bacterium]